MLGIFNTDPELQSRFEEWTTCKQYINQDLVKNLTSYDPTAKEHIVKVDAKTLARILQGKITCHARTFLRALQGFMRWKL